MELKQVVAIVRGSVLEAVEERLRQVGVKGISVSPIRGYGEYANLYKADRMVTNVKIEIFTEQSAVEDIVTAIMNTAHLGISGDGIVAVLPVEKLYRIRTKTEIEPHEC
jgi:nitrogen regulatory protein P-II 1